MTHPDGGSGGSSDGGTTGPGRTNNPPVPKPTSENKPKPKPKS